MKRILITGENSYIGVALKKWLMKEPDKYEVHSVSLRNVGLEKKDFSIYDVVVHVAGIAHVKETRDNRSLYYEINRDLAVKTAQKSKKDGVAQFIFLSSMSVYGMNTGVINKKTKPEPKTDYGKSKFEAERLISRLQDKTFSISILRPPMVYGKNCKGNYPKLSRFAQKTFFFPDIVNKRSMIYIDNLTEFIKQIINSVDSGLFFPQNSEYVNTSELVYCIAKYHNKKICLTKIFNLLLRILNIGVLNKVFGSLVYELEISEYKNNYRIYGFKETIKLSEGEL